MNATKTNNSSPSESDAQEDKQERHIYWRRVRRRLLGAGAMVLLVVFLWRLGDIPSPPDINPSLPPDEVPTLETPSALVVARQQLQKVMDFSLFSDDESDTSAAADDTDSDGILDNADDADDLNQAEEAEILDDESDANNADDLNDLQNDDNVAEASAVTPTQQIEIDEKEDAPEESAADLFVKPIKSEESTAAIKPTPEFTAADNPEVAQALKKPFIVHVTSLSIRQNALNVQKILQENQFIVYIEQATVNGVLFYRMRVAGYASRAEAELARRKIVALGYPNAEVRDAR